MDVVISKRRGAITYHDPNAFCPYVKRISKKNRRYLPDYIAKKKGYCKCKFCMSLRGIAYKYRQRGYDCMYDKVSNSICIRTDISFWKAIWYEDEEAFHLFHMNAYGYKNFNPNLPSRVLVGGRFHRQTDVPPKATLDSIINYILAHDKNKKIIMDDYRKMPKNTAKQRKYYKQAKKRKRRDELRRLDHIFKQLENNKK